MLFCPWRWSAPLPSRNLVYSAAATAISNLFKVRPSFLSPGLPSQSNTPKALSYHLASTPFMSSNDGGRSLRRSMPHSTPTLSTRGERGAVWCDLEDFSNRTRPHCSLQWFSKWSTTRKKHTWNCESIENLLNPQEDVAVAQTNNRVKELENSCIGQAAKIGEHNHLVHCCQG